MTKKHDTLVRQPLRSITLKATTGEPVQQCTVNGSNKTLPSQYASWSMATGLTLASQCDWICHDGYTKDSDGENCVLKVPSVTSVTITGLESIDGGKEGTNSRSLTVSISATNVSHYYLTHIAPGTNSGQFTPAGKVGDASAKEGTRTWSSATPSPYALPQSLSDGEHKLYLWVANVEKDIIGSATASGAFTLDTTAPALALGTTHPLEKDKGTTATFSILNTTDETIVSYTYCVGTSGCTLDSHFTDITTSHNFPVSVTTSSLGGYRIIFKATDEFSHTASFTYTWNKVHCFDKETRSIAVTDGTRAQSCDTSTGDWVNGDDYLYRLHPLRGQCRGHGLYHLSCRRAPHQWSL